MRRKTLTLQNKPLRLQDQSRDQKLSSCYFAYGGVQRIVLSTGVYVCLSVCPPA